MTRIGIISDIHANYIALRAIIRKLKQAGVDRFWCLGDVLGYGPYPSQTLQALNKLKPDIWLTGNHDCYIAPLAPNLPRGATRLSGPIYATEDDGKRIRVQGPRETAWNIAQRHRELLEDSDLITVMKYPPFAQPADLPNVLLVHAIYQSGADLSALVETSAKQPSDFRRFFTHSDAPWHKADPTLPFLHVAGHTHIESLWEYPLGQETSNLMEAQVIEYDRPYPLLPAHFYYINPGSVGFPRGQSPCPTAAILDTAKWEVIFCSLQDMGYNPELVRDAMQAQDYPKDSWSERQLRPCIC